MKSTLETWGRAALCMGLFACNGARDGGGTIGRHSKLEATGEAVVSVTGPSAVSEQEGVATYTVSLSPASASPVTVRFVASDGTARQGRDFVSTGVTLTFVPGQTTKVVPVGINKDTIDEWDEFFEPRLVDPKGAVLAEPSTLMTTILDSDPEPTLSVRTADAFGNLAKLTPLVEPDLLTVGVTAVLSNPTEKGDVNFTILVGGTATQYQDYDSGWGSPFGLLTIYKGRTTAVPFPSVTIFGDDIPEPTETLAFTLAPWVPAFGAPYSIASQSGGDATTITILDNDGPVTGASLQVSASPDRSTFGELAGATLKGRSFIFVSVPPTEVVTSVLFWLDDPAMTGPPVMTEKVAPFDFAGTAANREALPFDPRVLSDGPHVVSAQVMDSKGTPQHLDAPFTVATPPPELLVSSKPDRSGAVRLENATLQGLVYIFFEPGAAATRVRFWLDKGTGPDATSEETTEPYDFAGTAPGSGGRLALPFDTRSVAAGSHMLRASPDLASGLGGSEIPAEFTVVH